MAETTTNPLDDSLAKFLAGPGKKASPGVPIAYDPGLTNPAAPSTLPVTSPFRPAGDVITLKQAPGKNFTPAQKWEHERGLAALDIARQRMAIEQGQANFQNIANALQLQDLMRGGTSGRSSGGSSYGGGYGGGTVLRPYPYGPNNRALPNTPHYLPPTYMNTAQRYLPPGNTQSGVLYAPTNLGSGPMLGTWADQALKQAMAGGYRPPTLIQRYAGEDRSSGSLPGYSYR